MSSLLGGFSESYSGWKPVALVWLVSRLWPDGDQTVNGFAPFPSFPAVTLAAPSNLSFSLVPTSRNKGSLRQHVFSVQEPDMPWHLQTVLM